MTSRRQLLKTLALTPLAATAASVQAAPSPKASTQFKYSLNTSTIRGQKLSLPKIIELAARAGYDGFEPWMMEIEAYVKEGKTLASLKKLASDAGLEFFDCIGFPTWHSLRATCWATCRTPTWWWLSAACCCWAWAPGRW